MMARKTSKKRKAAVDNIEAKYTETSRYEVGNTTVVEIDFSAEHTQDVGRPLQAFAGLYFKDEFIRMLIIDSSLSDNLKERIKRDIDDLKRRGCTKAHYFIDPTGELECSFSPNDFEDFPPA